MAKGERRLKKSENLQTADWGLDRDDKTGPWFTASYSGTTLSCCGEENEEGNEIRADGEGGYQGRCCYPGRDD